VAARAGDAGDVDADLEPRERDCRETTSRASRRSVHERL